MKKVGEIIRTLETVKNLPTRQQLRLIDTAAKIRAESARARDLIYQARELVQATLPHSAPKGNPPVWTRTNGDLTLTIRPAYRRETCLGYPYGSIPRLLLFWITTEAVRKRQRRLELGASLNSFLAHLGLNPATGGGPRSDAARMKLQMERLLRATISFDYSDTSDPDNHHHQWLDMEIAPKASLWWNPLTPDQAALWGSWIELGETFFEAITAHPVPVDIRALRTLKQSPLALDLYAWLVYRSFTMAKKDRPVFVPWKLLQGQLGAEYGNPKDFKRKCKEALRKIHALYGAGVPFEDVHGGLKLLPNRQMIPCSA